jgi:hypothetical protein
MKSYNVKSNAKRAAKGLVDRNAGLAVCEPVAAENGEWFPAVQAVEQGAMISLEVRQTAVVVSGVTACAAHPVVEDELVAAAEEPVQAEQPAVEAAADEPAAVPAKMTEAEMAAAVADLPVAKSTPEEIAARREARRQRKAAEAEAPAKEPKTTRASVVLGLMKRPGGATQPELLETTGWLPHTLRGFISGTLRKAGYAVETERAAGVTRYSIA